MARSEMVNGIPEKSSVREKQILIGCTNKNSFFQSRKKTKKKLILIYDKYRLVELPQVSLEWID